MSHKGLKINWTFFNLSLILLVVEFKKQLKHIRNYFLNRYIFCRFMLQLKTFDKMCKCLSAFDPPFNPIREGISKTTEICIQLFLGDPFSRISSSYLNRLLRYSKMVHNFSSHIRPSHGRKFEESRFRIPFQKIIFQIF